MLFALAGVRSRMIELQSDLEYVVSDRLKVSLDAIAQFCQR